MFREPIWSFNSGKRIFLIAVDLPIGIFSKGEIEFADREFLLKGNIRIAIGFILKGLDPRY
jgi:hypothetical protein